jgi:hypothetical protein
VRNAADLPSSFQVCCGPTLLPLQNMLRLRNAVGLLSVCVKLLEHHPSILQQLFSNAGHVFGL